jgi:hypothetical protein
MIGFVGKSAALAVIEAVATTAVAAIAVKRPATGRDIFIGLLPLWHAVPIARNARSGRPTLL